MKKNKLNNIEEISQLIESFNTDANELSAFMDNPKRYLEVLGIKDFSGLSDDDLRKMIQNHVEQY